MKRQTKKQRSQEWKKQNDWGLTVAERSAKREIRTRKAIEDKIESGQDASLLIELWEESFGKKF